MRGGVSDVFFDIETIFSLGNWGKTFNKTNKELTIFLLPEIYGILADPVQTNKRKQSLNRNIIYVTDNTYNQNEILKTTFNS